MQFLVLVYNDPALLGAVPAEQFDSTMRGCLAKADELRAHGRLLQSAMLEDPATARSIRVRGGRRLVHDGPFAETKEVLGGFNLIEAADMEEAVRLAASFPWAETGCLEVRPLRDVAAVRQRVGAPPAAEALPA